MRTLHADLRIYMLISCSVLLRMRNVSNKQKLKNTHFIFENLFFFLKILLLMWENMVHPDMLQIAIQHVRTVCWVTKATHTLRICNTYCFSPATLVKRTHLVTFMFTLPLLQRIFKQMEFNEGSSYHTDCLWKQLTLLFLRRFDHWAGIVMEVS